MAESGKQRRAAAALKDSAQGKDDRDTYMALAAGLDKARTR
jgi:hypothetical protein